VDRQQRDNLSSWWQGTVLWEVCMAEYTTLRAGGKAEALIDVRTIAELSTLVKWLTAQGIVSRVLGQGSNILVPEQGYPGVLIRLRGEIQSLSCRPTKDDGTVVVRAGAGCAMSSVVSWCTRNGLSGLEFLVGIPGSVGGAVWMNAGAWGHETGERLEQIVMVDRGGSLVHVPAKRLLFSYRQLAWQDGDLDGMTIVSADFVVCPGGEQSIRERCRGYLERRKAKQPKGVASAGSFFKNPPGDSAGRLIDAAGLKGFTIGGAMVSPVHANFIVNTGGATAVEIIGLMEVVQEKVYQRFGVRLEPEVQILQG